jgi:hypothetical protein
MIFNSLSIKKNDDVNLIYYFNVLGGSSSGRLVTSRKKIIIGQKKNTKISGHSFNNIVSYIFKNILGRPNLKLK